MSAQPTGTVTFLFTDLEGSTKLWEQYPTEMRAALKRHDDLLRHAIQSNRGYIFKTIGDAFCAAFSQPTDAVAAAADAQRALTTETWGDTGPLRARMAIHTGEPEARGGDYFGQPVNRVARLLSIGHGQQVLLSEATQQLVHDRLPTGCQLRSRGKHRLKDLNRPQLVFQLLSTNWPVNLKSLKSLPSPATGAVAALGTTAVTVVFYSLRTRSSSESVGTGLFSPASLYTSLKGFVLDLSTFNEYLLLGTGLGLLLLSTCVALARRWQLQREESLRTPEGGRVFNWMVNQRTFTFFAVLALIVIGAYAYQQYLWRVVLPIPEEATGFAITREATAASFQDQLVDSLYTQGQATEIIVRALPVTFDASDTARARELGERINAEAVIIYRVDGSPQHESERYVAYVVFTDPNVGLMLGAPAEGAAAGPATALPTVQLKEGVAVPVLKTATLNELVNAAAGIIDYNDHRLRDSIEHLEQAVPQDADAANTGIVQFYLGNAYQLDGHMAAATLALESAVAFYEARMGDGELLGAQDTLLLLKTYVERGEIAAVQGDWETAIDWYDKGLPLREDLVSRADGLERPSDVPATYARLYTLMADVYRSRDQSEDEAFWQGRAADELSLLAENQLSTDPYPLIQQGTARFFLGECVAAADAFTRALVIQPGNIDAQTNIGIIALLQGREDVALAAWQDVVSMHPDNVSARMLIANLYVLRGIKEGYLDVESLLEAEQYYRDVISLDPTNLAAQDAIADLAQLRAQAAMLDSTALSTGDDLNFQKSQAEWRADPDRQEEALDAYNVVIEHRRITASELTSGDAATQASVATAYAERETFLFSILLDEAIQEAAEMPEQETTGATPQAATPVPAATAMEQQFLDDGKQVLEWSSRVLENPDAPRLATIQAHAARVGSTQRVWSWYTYLAPDSERSAAAEEDFRHAVEEGIAFGELVQPTPLDEIASLRLIYFSAVLLASLLDEDDAAASALEEKILEISMQEAEERGESTTHLMTFCDEVQEANAGDAAFGRGDEEEALDRYDAALEANPSYVPALLGSGSVLFEQGKIDGAIGMAEDATEASPMDHEAWADVALYRLAAGDAEGAQEAYDRFFELLGNTGPQLRMASVNGALDDLSRILDGAQGGAAELRFVLTLFSSFLETMDEDAQRSYQYAGLYVELGSLALQVDAPEDAETWLSRALELDLHQPAAYPNLVMAVAAQGEDPAPEIDMAIREAGEPIWARTTDIDHDRVLSIMEDEALALQRTFPQEGEAMEELISAIESEREQP